MNYFVKTPWWLKRLYPKRVWSIDTDQKIIYPTFDDGPHPEITPFVLDQLNQFNAKATFFCIGKNVEQYRALYDRILDEGHRTGNHTQQHLNGWKTDDTTYLADITTATKHIQSDLFRPPYGRLRSSQAKAVASSMKISSAKIIMWDVLSGDFDESLSKENCLQYAMRAKPGSIIVFHDSQKAFERLRYALPEFLKSYTEKGYVFHSL